MIINRRVVSARAPLRFLGTCPRKSWAGGEMAKERFVISIKTTSLLICLLAAWYDSAQEWPKMSGGSSLKVSGCSSLRIVSHANILLDAGTHSTVYAVHKRDAGWHAVKVIDVERGHLPPHDVKTEVDMLRRIEGRNVSERIWP